MSNGTASTANDMVLCVDCDSRRFGFWILDTIKPAVGGTFNTYSPSRTRQASFKIVHVGSAFQPI
jgi:hypothetical protein